MYLVHYLAMDSKAKTGTIFDPLTPRRCGMACDAVGYPTEGGGDRGPDTAESGRPQQANTGLAGGPGGATCVWANPTPKWDHLGWRGTDREGVGC
jgi:hypothetical protein